MKKLQLVCNAHIDPVWHWHFNEGIGCAISTFRAAAEIAEDDKNNAFVFNHNEAILYRYIEKLDPSLFARIKKLVAAGKWHIMGGWYLQPDCNKLAGESFVRQITRGQKFFKEKFGVCPTTAANFDSFGHTRGLVQILDKCGYDSYVFCRPNVFAGGTDIPAHTFKWKGFADTEVTGANQYPYNSPLGLAECVVRNYINAHQDDTLVDNHFLLWGVGNHGGGPSKIDVENINELIGKRTDIEIVHSTLDDYFAELHASNPKLPEFDKSITKVMVGCYTSQSKVKREHRELENALKIAEMMSVHAEIAAGREYPYEKIEEIEDCLLLSQFHDILPGSSSLAAMEGAVRTMHRGLDIAEEVKTAAFYALTSGQPRGESNILPLLVYNSTPYAENFDFENEFTLAVQNYSERFNQVTVMQNGKVIPSQLEQDTSNIPIDWRKRVIINAKLEPMSMNRFDLVVEMIDSKPKKKQYTDRFITVNRKNSVFSIDTETGLINKYAVNGIDYLKENAGKLIVFKDNFDPWGMKVTEFRELDGEFRLATPKEAAKICCVHDETLAPVRVIDDGEIRTVIEAVFCYETSYAIVKYFVSKLTDDIKISIKLFSSLQHNMVKLCMPTVFNTPVVNGKTSFGAEPLETDGTETVSQEYLLISEEDKALSIIKQGVYGGHSENGDIYISLIRAANYCAHPIKDYLATPQDRFSDCIDTGESRFDFVINAGSLAEREASIEREAVKVAQAPITICFYPSNEGEKPKPLCQVENTLISLERFVVNQNGNYNVHFFNSSQAMQKSKINFPALNISTEIELKPYEVMAYEISKDGKIAETTLNA